MFCLRVCVWLWHAARALQAVKLQSTSFEGPGLLRMEFDKYVASLVSQRR